MYRFPSPKTCTIPFFSKLHTSLKNQVKTLQKQQILKFPQKSSRNNKTPQKSNKNFPKTTNFLKKHRNPQILSNLQQQKSITQKHPSPSFPSKPHEQTAPKSYQNR
jgi:hypothetical protein